MWPLGAVSYYSHNISNSPPSANSVVLGIPVTNYSKEVCSETCIGTRCCGSVCSVVRNGLAESQVEKSLTKQPVLKDTMSHDEETEPQDASLCCDTKNVLSFYTVFHNAGPHSLLTLGPNESFVVTDIWVQSYIGHNWKFFLRKSETPVFEGNVAMQMYGSSYLEFHFESGIRFFPGNEIDVFTNLSGSGGFTWPSGSAVISGYYVYD